MAEPPEFARYGEKCPRTGGEHSISLMTARCRHCNGKAVGWTWARVDAAQKARVALPIVTGPAPFAEQPETRNGLSPLPIAVPDGHRAETYFTNASINGKPQTVSWSKPSAPDTWDAAFADPQSQSYEAIKGWTSVDVIPPPQSFQQVDAENQRAMLANPVHAKLTCDRNGWEPDAKSLSDPGRYARMKALVEGAPRPSDAADATAYMMTGFAQREIAELKERVATLEADNRTLESQKDCAAERLGFMRSAMKKWRTIALQRSIELATLKMAKPSQAMTLPEPEKPSQDAIWRNATRFSR